MSHSDEANTKTYYIEHNEETKLLIIIIIIKYTKLINYNYKLRYSGEELKYILKGKEAYTE